MSNEQIATAFPVEDHSAAVNGIDLHYRVAGDGPVLFLVPPGWGVGSHYLQRGFISLAERHKLIFVDTRASGRSSRPADPSQMRSIDMADDLEALRIHLGFSKVSVLGHSNSGAIALSYAERFPEHLDKLIVSGSQVLGLSASADTQRILQERATDPRFEAAVQAVSAFFGGQASPPKDDEALGAFIARVLPLYLYQPEKTLSLLQQQLAGPISSYAFNAQFAADAADRTDLTQALNQIAAKTLILVGRHDFICPVALSEHLHKRIPPSQLAIFEESGHFPWLEEPEKFFATLNDFLRRPA
ncbi:pimeloyl-ACP methyl ester carboxylesterase [Silvibacterium bohemicum]|uniref:Pimeloyl-ACP methyl ester carboxylesterase n=1 Tax=Silvibacterium bohemicum TaxID=1577686 RepID=A0A841JS50_9BACT|nr:alpha/beta hydrolase [Silvibacterium bohemicum]MBB6144233.1 pimeloyl-ACP methyl ester carboxylesterase [Silvibacterium bohemicum]